MVAGVCSSCCRHVISATWLHERRINVTPRRAMVFKQFHFAICSWSQSTLVRPEHTREDFAGLMLCSSPLGSSFVRDWSLLAMSAKRRLAFFLRKAASVALGWSLHGISCIYILISIRRFNLGSQFVSLWEFVVDP